MKNQKIVEIENGKIHAIYDGNFEKIYVNQENALIDLYSHYSGTDWKGFISKLEKIIIGCSRRHPEDEEYFKEMMPNRWFENTKQYYSNTNIKTRTEKEKQELVDKIISDKY